MIKEYYHLAKPGIIYGNLITATAGFFLAARSHGNYLVLLAMLLGMSLVIGSYCVFNNIYDTDIDSMMERTKHRALVARTISKRAALVYGFILGILGVITLYFGTNLLTLAVAEFGGLVYLFVYTPLKRTSIHSTLFGSISGAVPPVVGYVSVINHLDVAAYILFAILVFWQMPHFYSIAIFRQKDYSEARIPVLPIKVGVNTAKKIIIGYIGLFLAAVFSLWFLGYTGMFFLVIAMLLGMYWLVIGIQGIKSPDSTAWARRMFRISLITLTMTSVVLAIGAIINI